MNECFYISIEKLLEFMISDLREELEEMVEWREEEEDIVE